MTIVSDNDHGTLKWVKDEIENTLVDAKSSLEAYIGNPSDQSKLQFCATYTHQVRGSLQMLEFYGAAMVAEEMEAVTKAILDDRVEQHQDACAALLKALEQFPKYLSHLESGGKDVPVSLMPILDDLRAVRGGHLLSRSLFAPTLEQSFIQEGELSEEESKTAVSKEELAAAAKKLRTHYQLGLIGWFKNSEDKGSFERMLKPLLLLVKVCSRQPSRRFWRVAGAMVESLYNQQDAVSVAIKQLLGRIDREVKRLSEVGEDGFIDTFPSDLMKNMLYAVANSKSTRPRVVLVKKEFDLDSLVSAEGEGQSEGAGQDPGVEFMDAVLVTTRDELAQVKDELDHFAEDASSATSESLAKVSGLLDKVADTLGMLGLGVLRQMVVEQQVAIAQGMFLGSESVDREKVKEVSGAIGYVVSNLGEIQRRVKELAANKEEKSSAEMLSEAEFVQLRKAVLNEITVDMARIKEAIIEYTQSPDNHTILADVPQFMYQVKGGLAMMEMPNATDLLDTVNAYVNGNLLSLKQIPQQAELDALAETISGVEYHLEAIGEGRLDDSTLHVAENSGQHLKRLIDEAIEAVTEAKLRNQGMDSFAGQDLEREMPVEEPAVPVAAEVPEEAAVEYVEEDDLDDDFDDDIFDVFMEEASEVLSTIQSAYPIWRSTTDDESSRTDVRRAFHTLKGSGRVAGANVIGDFAWAIENLLNQVIDGVVRQQPALFSFMDRVLEALPDLIEECRQSGGDITASEVVRTLAEQAQNATKGLGFPEIDLVAAEEEALAQAGDEATEVTPVEEDLVTDEVQETAPMEESSADEMELTEALEDALVEDDEASLEDAVVEERAAADDITESTQEHVAEEHAVDESEPAEAQAHEPGSDEEAEAAAQPAVDPMLIEIFSNEGKEHINVIAEFVEAHRESPKINVTFDLQRALHTLQGAAHMAGFTDIAEIASALEDYVDICNRAELTIDAEILQLFSDIVEELQRCLANLATTGGEINDKVSLLRRLRAFQARVDQEQLTAPDWNKMATAQIENEVDEYAAIEDDDDDDDESVEEIFLEEAEEILERTNEIVETWCAAPLDTEIQSGFEREIHTLKGGARTAGFNIIGDLTHAMESLLNAMGRQEVDDIDEAVAAVQEAHDCLNTMVESARAEAEVALPVDLIKRLEKLAKEEQADDVVEEVDVEALESNEVSMESSVEHISAEQTDERSQETTEDEQAVTAEAEDAEESAAFGETTIDDAANLDSGELDLYAEPEDDLTQAEEGVDQPIELEDALGDELGLYSSEDEQAVNDEAIEQIEEDSLNDLYTVADEVTDEDEVDLQIDEQMSAEEARFDEPSEEINEVEAIEEIDDSISEVDEAVDQAAESILELDGETSDLTSMLDDYTDDYTDDQLDDELMAASTEEGIAEEEIVELNDNVNEAAVSEVHASDDEEFMDETVEIFLEEAAEILDSTDDLIQQWRSTPTEMQYIREFERKLHTLKGGARLAKLEPIGDLSHAMESVLCKFSSGEAQANEYSVDLVQRSLDRLQVMREQVAKKETVDPSLELVKEVNGFLTKLQSEEHVEGEQQAQDSQQPEAQATEAVDAKAEQQRQLDKEREEELAREEAAIREGDIAALMNKNSNEQIRIPSSVVDVFANQAAEISINRGRIQQQINAFRFNLRDMDQTITRLREQLRKMEIETEAQILFRHEEASAQGEDFDPLEFDRFTHMQQLSRSLMESSTDLLSIREQLETVGGEAETLLIQQGRVNTELQEGIMGTRMVRFSKITPRLRRLVRQVARELLKKVEFEVHGGDGEMDRRLLDRMIGPLEHMVRNAIDHGLEGPVERLASRKPEAGRLTISFEREGQDAIVRVSDDGAGMNLKAIRQKAIDRGLVDADAELTEDDIVQFVLESGFSTAGQLTQISGRGVGMDVVVNEIKQLGGTMEIETNAGQGTAFVIRLPVTLATSRAIFVQAGEELYAVPLSSVEGVARIDRSVFAQFNSETTPTFEYAGNEYQVHSMGTVLGVPNMEFGEDLKNVPILLVNAGGHRMGMMVTGFLGSREIVVKPVGQQLSSVRGVSGAAIMGDGSVVLVLDVGNLVRMGMITTRVHAVVDEPKPKKADRPLTVMIVDDSITVRKVTSRFLKRKQINTMTAKDGVDALEKLQQHQLPDVMLLDIEMPRMDGYELASTIRNDERLKHIPIIMITSRIGDKHRNRAMQIGVNVYLGKPYQESDLLEHIKALASVEDE